MSNLEHLSLFRSYLPCPNSELFTVCFVRFLSLLGRFWKFLRVSLNDLDWLENQISRFFQIRFSGKAVCVVFGVLVGSHSSELRINHRLFF